MEAVLLDDLSKLDKLWLLEEFGHCWHASPTVARHAKITLKNHLGFFLKSFNPLASLGCFIRLWFFTEYSFFQGMLEALTCLLDSQLQLTAKGGGGKEAVVAECSDLAASLCSEVLRTLFLFRRQLTWIGILLFTGTLCQTRLWALSSSLRRT